MPIRWHSGSTVVSEFRGCQCKYRLWDPFVNLPKNYFRMKSEGIVFRIIIISCYLIRSHFRSSFKINIFSPAVMQTSLSLSLCVSVTGQLIGSSGESDSNGIMSVSTYDQACLLKRNVSQKDIGGVARKSFCQQVRLSLSFFHPHECICLLMCMSQ